MKRFAVVVLVVLSAIVVVGGSSGPAQAQPFADRDGWTDDVAWLVKPGVGIGPIRIGDRAEVAVAALARYEGKTSEIGPGVFCSEPGEYVCLLVRGDRVRAVDAQRNTEAWLSIPNGETLHVLSAGPESFADAWGAPDSVTGATMFGVPSIVASWHSRGVMLIFMSAEGSPIAGGPSAILMTILVER